MNSNTSTQSDHVSPISLLPKTHTETNICFRLRLGFIPQRKRKSIIVNYHNFEGVLVAYMMKTDGTVFMNKDAAERWFEGNIDISPHVGKRIVTSTINDVNHYVICHGCGLNHFKKTRTFIGTEDMFESDEPVSTEILDECPKCHEMRKIDVSEHIEDGVD